MTINLKQAFYAARRASGASYWRPACKALPMARAALAELESADLARRAAWAARAEAQKVDSRRYAPGMVAANEACQKAESRWSRAYDNAARAQSWRGQGSGGGQPWELSRGTWLQWVESVPFRLAGFADELARLGHSGWHTDPEGDGELARGIVYQMAGRDGRARYIPGIADPYNNGPAMLALGDAITAEGPEEWQAEEAAKEAARRADRLAEIYAERERDYQEAWWAGRGAREKAKEARDAGAEYVAAARALRARLAVRHGLGLVGLSPDDCRALARAALADLRAACEAYKEARDTAREFISDSRPGRRDDLRAAWAEGYAE